MQWLAEICIKRPVFATMLVLSIVVVGAFALTTLGVDRFPNVDAPTISVSVTNEGAAPQEIETEITQPLEDQLNTISGLETMTSTSSEGQSLITLEFDLDKDVDTVAQDVRDKVNLAAGQLPSTAKDPIIQKRDPNSQPILQIAVSGQGPQRELYTLVDKQIKERLQNVSGVSDVSIVGAGEREIQVLLDPERMKAYGVTATDVANALQKQNQEAPGGRLTQGASEITVRTLGKVQTVEDFKSIPVIRRDNYSVLLTDIAEVKDGVVEARSISLLNGANALTVQVMKQSGGNTVTVANNVKARLAEIQRSLGDKVKMTTVTDQSTYIEASVRTVEEHLIIGSILASLVVLGFLANSRMTLIAALAIPTSIVGTFAFMWAMGYTLNMLTMLALTLMIGIVIDDAIIVLENIYHFIERGMKPFEAAVAGTKEVGLAVMATTMSLLAVFVPVGFMSGMVGRFMGSFGLTASAAIAISLFVSFALTPTLCARFIGPKRRGSAAGGAERASIIQKFKSKDFFKPVVDFYIWMLRWSMNHRRIVVGACAVVLLSNVLLIKLIGVDFIPTDDESAFQVTVEAPEGTTLAAMTTVAERIAKDMRALPGVTDTLTTVGGGGGGFGESGASSVNSATIFVKLTDLDKRDLSQNELTTKAREILKQYPSDLKTNARSASGFGANYSVQYILRGPDLDKLAAYADEIAKQLRQDPNAVDVDTSLANSKPELRVNVDRQRAADLGVSAQDISQAINILLTGSVATTFNTGEDQFDVRVRASGVYRQRLEDLKQMSVRSDKNEIIPLDQLVKIEKGAAAASIERYNRQRQVTIYSNVKEGASALDVSDKLTQIVQNMRLDPAYQTTQTGASKNMSDSIYYFALASVMSFIFMYMVLASQFESFIHPVTILLTLPLAVPFGLLSLILTGQSLNLLSLLGVLVLFGIVKKNAILQIDHTNQLRERGMSRDEAIIQANRDRLRPILMTTIAFVAGMIPLVLTTGTGAATNRSIGTLVAGGQTFCLLLTLLAVPVFYSIWDDFGHHPFFGKIAARWRLFKRNFKRRLRPASAARVKARAFVFAFVLLTPGLLKGQTQNGAGGERVGVDVSNQIPLSLSDAIKLALENNNEIEAATLNVKSAGFTLKAARGAYDPTLSFQSFYEKSATPVASALGGASNGSLTDKTASGALNLIANVPWQGGAYQVESSSSRVYTNNSFTQLNPQFMSSLLLTYTQPLWRNRGIDDNRRQIAVAKKNLTLTDAQFRAKVIETIAAVQSAYWDLVYAIRNLQVQTDAVTQARDQLESNRRQVEAGVLASIDIVESQAQVTDYEQGVASAQESVTAAENTLKTLMLPDRKHESWSRALQPVTPVSLDLPRIPLEQAVESALKNRPEIAEIETNTEINNINTSYYRNQTKPQVNLVTTFNPVGISGTEVENISNPFPGAGGALPENLVGGYGRSLSNLYSMDYPTWKVGLSISLPLRNRTAQANLGKSLAASASIKSQRDQQEQRIESEVRNAFQAMRSAEARLKAATASRESAEKLYESEQRKLQIGASTVYMALERQQALVNARGAELQAQTTLNKAIATYEKVTGVTLQVNQITLNTGE